MNIYAEITKCLASMDTCQTFLQLALLAQGFDNVIQLKYIFQIYTILVLKTSDDCKQVGGYNMYDTDHRYLINSNTQGLRGFFVFKDHKM